MTSAADERSGEASVDDALPGARPSAFYRLENTVQRYDWGSTSAIQDLLGVVPDGRPAAELWMGAHPLAPSRGGPPRGPPPRGAAPPPAATAA
ncbi:MAG: type I phosphomannose isomerase catalytic subunit, partial [Cellulosimicrobium funkei]